MNVQDCPYCKMRVATKADGRCPGCGEVIRSIVPAAESGSDFSDRHVDLGDIEPKKKSSNPYASPAVVDSGRAYSIHQENTGLMRILFSFQGRIPRRVYWSVSILSTVTIYMAGFGLAVMFGEDASVTKMGVLAMYVPMLWISLAITVKRWHDRGKSGWWMFISIIPVIGPLWHFIETGCLRGDTGPNQYGPDPT